SARGPDGCRHPSTGRAGWSCATARGSGRGDPVQEVLLGDLNPAGLAELLEVVETHPDDPEMRAETIGDLGCGDGDAMLVAQQCRMVDAAERAGVGEMRDRVTGGVAS